MNTIRTGIALVVAATIISGCSSSGMDVESDQIATRNIWAGMVLESRGNGNTRVKVELNESGRSGSNIRLAANERLEVNAGGLIVTLKEDVDFGDIDYEGTVPTDAGSTLFRISLFRADGTINSGSSVSIPSPFDIASPVGGQNFSSGSRMPLTWSAGNPGGNVELEVSVSCPSGTVAVEWFQINDSGTRSFDVNNLSIMRNNSLPSGTQCDMDIALRRERTGRLDPAFRGGGFVHATQIRRVENLTLRLP